MQTPPPGTTSLARASVVHKPPALKRPIHIALPARQCSSAHPFPQTAQCGGAEQLRTQAEEELVAWARSILGKPPRGTAEDEEGRLPAPSVSRSLTSPRRFAEPPPKILKTGGISAFSTYAGAHVAARKSVKHDE